MAVIFSDEQILSLVSERKSLSSDWRARMALRSKRRHQEGYLDCGGESGNRFRVIFRQNGLNFLDFSIILAVRVPQSNRLFRLRRYNGRSHQHTNSIERDTFYGYHIHMATERYQEIGAQEDAYAEVTDRYNDLPGALQCLLQDAGFDLPIDSQPNLF